MKFIKISVIFFFGCLVVLSACSTDDNNAEITTMKINHFKQSGESLFPSQFLLVQEGTTIGDKDWSVFYNGIEDFNYELGYLYTLKVEKETLENPPADGSSIRYKLIEEISKEKAPLDTPFQILLSSRSNNNDYFQPFFKKIENSTFELLDGTKINCGGFCDELAEKLTDKQPIIGVFYHSINNELLLIDLK